MFQTLSVKTDDFYQMIAAHRPDIMVVVAFGHVLPKKNPGNPHIRRHQCACVFASKVSRACADSMGDHQWGNRNRRHHDADGYGPGYRGNAPVVIELISHPDDTAGTLHDRLSEVGASLLIDTIQKIKDGSLRPIPQNHALSSYAPMLTKENGHIDWKKPADHIERFIRGMTPWPGAFTFVNDKRMRIFKAKVWDSALSDIPGKVIKGFSNELCVATGKGVLSILEIQMDSGKRLEIREFLKGASIPANAEMS